MKVFKKLFYFTFITSTVLASFTSCGNNRKPSSVNFDVNSEMMAVQPLTSDELNIAGRICYAYKSKGAKYRTDYAQKTFSFRLYQKSCEGAESSRSIDATLNAEFGGEVMSYLPKSAVNPGEFLATVQTDRVGFLKTICEKIYRGESISNTVDIDGVKAQVVFERKNLDRYKLNYFVAQGFSGNESKYVIHSSDVITVRTQFDWSNGQILGNDEEILRYTKCSTTSDKVKEVSQSFISVK